MTQKFNTLADAIRLAEFAHFSQVDKAGLPYIKHPMRVLEKVQAQGALPYVQMAAVLHDVTEDTKITTDVLLTMGFPESAVNIVRLLDRAASANTYATQTEFVRLHNGQWWTGTKYVDPSLIPDADTFYYEQIRLNPQAIMVKLADIEDNLAPWRQTYLSAETQERLAAKYAKAREILEGK